MNNLQWSLICWSYSRAIQTEAQPRFVIHLVICSFSLDLDGLSHLLPPNLYLAKREGNSNKKRISRTSNYQNLTCQKTKLEFINMHTLKMNLPYWVLFLEVNQVARVQGEMTYSIKNISPAQIWSIMLQVRISSHPPLRVPGIPLLPLCLLCIPVGPLSVPLISWCCCSSAKTFRMIRSLAWYEVP